MTDPATEQFRYPHAPECCTHGDGVHSRARCQSGGCQCTRESWLAWWTLATAKQVGEEVRRGGGVVPTPDATGQPDDGHDNPTAGRPGYGEAALTVPLCHRCGALVGDPDVHDDWHHTLDEVAHVAIGRQS